MTSERPEGSAPGALEGEILDPANLDEMGPEGPRGAFTIEGRPAQGLYVMGWLLGGLGVALLIVAFLTGSEAARLVLAGSGLVGVLLGSGAAAGYQVIARGARPASAYRGPAPLLVLVFTLALASLAALALQPLGLGDLQTGTGFLVGVLVPFGAYLVALTLLVVRTGALSWSAMVRLRPGGLAGPLQDYLVGALAGLAIILPVLLGVSVVARLLQLEPESQLPGLTGGLADLALVFGAVVIAPLGEELFYRGFAYTAWRADLGPRAALWRSALLFAVVHIFNVQASAGDDLARVGARVLLQFAIILPVALLLGFIYERRGLAASLGTHMAYNGGLLALAALALNATR